MRAMQGNGCNVTVVKTAMGLLGTDVGAVRPPGTRSLAAEDIQMLTQLLRGWKLEPS
jgi:4-hydroxy-tetrahydrodipicolinate synthase